jgi:hypothetical protein
MISSFSISHAEDNVKRDAWRVVSFTLAISALPLILGFVAQSTNKGVGSAFLDVFVSGELYFYAMTFCASMLVVGQLSIREENTNMRIWSVAFAVFCVGFMSLFIGFVPSDSATIPLVHRLASVLFLLLAVFLNYRVVVLADQPPPLPEAVNRERVMSMTNSVEPDYDQ